MNRKEKWNLARIILGALLLAPTVVLEYAVEARWATITEICLAVVAFLIVGYDVLWKSVLRIIHGQFMEESFLMSVASIGAFAIGEYPEAVAVMLFFQVGEFFEHRAVKRSRRSIKALLSINPDTATLCTEEGEVTTPCEEVQMGQVVLVRPGERVPLDGLVVEGNAELDMSSLNGESIPRTVTVGSEVLSGSVNLNGVLRIEVTKPFGESTASRMIALVQEAREQKAPVENFITTFAKFYTPIVVGVAAIIGILVPLCIRYNDWPTWAFWLKKAMVFLVVSCPCALVISVPLSYFGAIGLAGRMGILIKGGHIFAAVTKLNTVVMDKTGTMTQGKFEVREVWPPESKQEILQLAYLAERHSNHPIALSIVAACNAQLESVLVEKMESEPIDIEEIRGKGVHAKQGETEYLCGNAALMAEFDIQCQDVQTTGSLVWVAKNGELLGYIRVEDALKEDTVEAIAQMQKDGLRTILLSGDNRNAVEMAAKATGVDEYKAECLPQDKLAYVQDKMKEGTVAFVGDGINDAPVIAGADVGIAMGGIGQDAAIESADVVLMQDSLMQIGKLRRVAKKTQRIVKENIVFALAVKLGVMALSFTPVAESAAMMWLAVVADVGVAILAILNAMRAGRQ